MLQSKAKQDARRLREITIHAENLDNVVLTLRDDLKEANIRVAALGKSVAENESIITQANATAISRLATQPDAAISWRIQTVECLEISAPVTEGYVKREVDIFVEEYSFLISAEKFDIEASKDLVRIFVDFATLALKLWKTRADVRWYNARGFQDRPFQLGNPWVEVESSSVSTMGQRLNGRPIGLIVRPMILAKSLSTNGQWKDVVWLKALAWVSCEDAPTRSKGSA
ncbi:hypothetical protein MKX07_006281 [Trichoderma sp. CBMAI-0711]|nr:hypothetical protein MKX07_006281 [Trichoderma sp. CBMAI-0711]